MAADYKQSVTVVIKRSQINFSPYNPKKHTKEQVKKIKDNIKNVAFLGGIVWNSITSNLVDGHKRIMALDVINRYDGSEAKDYDVKVEQIELDEKTEKEQNIFQTQSRSDLDIDLMQLLIPEIDYKNAGLEIEDLNYYMPDVAVFDVPEYNEIKSDFQKLEELSDTDRAARVQAVKDAKQATKEKMRDEAEGDPFVILSFDSYDNKVVFMEMIQCHIEDKYVKGEKVLSIIDKA
jgi:ParB-like nuclease domain